MNQVPLVSVILTSYNHREYLEQALDSIFKQTYSNIEVIIVDDNSTDGSQIILNNYKERFPNIKLKLLDKNTGSYVNSSNYGASLASGAFINFAQCDDFSDAKQIEKLVAKAIQYPDAGVIYSKSYLIDSDGYIITDDYQNREISFKIKCFEDNLIKGDTMFKFLSYSCVIPNLSSAIIKRDLYTKMSGLSSNYKVAADWALWMDLSFITNFYYINEPLNFFRQHPNTIRNTIKFESQVLELFEIFYNLKKSKNLTFIQQKKLQIGVNIIWVGGLISNPLIFLKTFLSIISKTFKYNNLNIFYFFICVLKATKEALIKRATLLIKST